MSTFARCLARSERLFLRGCQRRCQHAAAWGVGDTCKRHHPWTASASVSKTVGRRKAARGFESHRFRLWSQIQAWVQEFIAHRGSGPSEVDYRWEPLTTACLEIA